MTLSLFSLEDKTVLITGGNGGLGRALAFGFRAAGTRVAVTGRNPEKNKAIAQELGTAVFLASAASDFVTGVSIRVDGGYSIAERFAQD